LGLGRLFQLRDPANIQQAAQPAADRVVETPTSSDDLSPTAIETSPEPSKPSTAKGWTVRRSTPETER